MNKKAIRLIVAAVLLVAVATALLVVTKINKGKGTGEINPTAVSQTKVKDIVGMTYTSESTGGKPINLVREDDIWYYEKDKEFPLDQEYVTDFMVTAATEATASKTVENPANDLSEYGLDSPIVTIVLKKVSGEEETLKIGSYNEGVQGYYLKVDGDDKIYLVDGQMVFAFDMSIYEIADKEDYPLVETTSFTHIKVQKGDYIVEFKGDVEEDSEEYVLKNSYLEKEKTWKVSEQGSVYKDGNQEALKSLIANLSGYKFTSMAAYKPSKEERAQFGLEDPAITLSVDYEVLDEETAREVEGEGGINEIVCDTIEKHYVLYIGAMAAENGYDDPAYYVALEGSQAVYTINAEMLADIVDMNVEQYR